MSTMWGTRRLTASKSSMVSSTSASLAMASRCRTALVDPAVAITTAAALRKAALVMIWRGRMSSFRRFTTASPVRRAASARRSDTAGGVAEPGRAMPMASDTAAMVLAVYMPAHDPAVGQATRSSSSRSSSDMVPAATAPTASYMSWTVTSRPRKCPGRMVPP